MDSILPQKLGVDEEFLSSGGTRGVIVGHAELNWTVAELDRC